MKEFFRIVSITCLLTVSLSTGVTAQDTDTPPVFRTGFGKRDITPTEPVPMWGYGARHDMLSTGILDPLMAKAIVVQAGEEKLAMVGLDLGRGPTIDMMKIIRETVAEKAGINHVLICGSHTHHGPVIELTDKEGFGQGKFDAAVAYSKALPGLLIEAILDANETLVDARMGVAKKEVPWNRNRHTKRQPKPTDPDMTVMRFDNLAGDPIAILVNYTAHPVMTDTMQLKFSADYPGFLQNKVEQEMGTNCAFIQGAAGDMSTNPPEGVKGPEQYGHALAGEAIALAKSIKTTVPATPVIKSKVDAFLFESRVPFNNPFVIQAFSRAFFPELVQNFNAENKDGVPAELNTVVLNDEIALVGGSGEFFCNHANRLKDRCYLDHTLFFGYCNGHNLYFPTIEATSEGGYGADMTVSPVEIGAGERMMDRALFNIYTMIGKYKANPFGS